MALERTYIRQGSKILGSVTTGYSDNSTTVHDSNGRIAGHTSEKFSTTLDASGRLISNNVSSPGLLIHKR